MTWLLLLLLLTGCTAADPAAWRLYTRGAYTFGRMESRVEVICTPPRNPNLSEFCREAADVAKQIHAIAPTIEAELSKDRTNWDAIQKYLDLVLGLAAKAL